MQTVAERNLAIERRGKRLAIEEAPIIVDLDAHGLHISSIWDLVNTSAEYSFALPVLARHLVLPYSDRTREGLARALAIKASSSIWPLLVEQYKISPVGKGIVAPDDDEVFNLGAKDGLAVALSVAVTRGTLPELVDLVEDRANGPSRLLLLKGVRKFRNPQTREILECFVDDPELALQVRIWLKLPKNKT
ncbi:hypothetical protein [Agrobacterium vitis]|uniref:Uncharacterized protein n=1 Tax=Agrobacterium vitis TaxID=373 RepID=A0A7K1RI60_AGRVI|nr:hypothetical protein [Agrobacterium vitis]MVA57671.1 hypothetical protein [Agrobacterium vitis]